MLQPDGDALANHVDRAIGARRLVYYGIRGGDAAPVDDLNLSAVVSLTDRYSGRSDVTTFAAEAISGHRIDLDGVVVMEPFVEAALRDALRDALDGGGVLMTYRPNPVVAEVVDAIDADITHAGIPHTLQSSFEYKPWVDSELSKRGMPTLGWTLVRRDDRVLVQRWLEGGDVILRPTAGTGGYGTRRLGSIEAFDEAMAASLESTMSISRYRPGGWAVNINAVAWHTGVTLHPASLQLIGLTELVDRPFAYCGNDFGAAARLEPIVIEEIETRTHQVGGWIRDHGYLGAFGVDYLVFENEVVFCELNPRFQGSSRLSDRIMQRLALPTVAVEHLASTLGVLPPAARRLADLMGSIPALAQTVFHRRGQDRDIASIDTRRVPSGLVLDVEVACPPEVIPDEGSVLLRAIWDGVLTDSGFELIGDAASIVPRIRSEVVSTQPPQATSTRT
ncbi:MAG: ATP-grasp domain-containing protein [Actinomycetota bacterium]